MKVEKTYFHLVFIIENINKISKILENINDDLTVKILDLVIPKIL